MRYTAFVKIIEGNDEFISIENDFILLQIFLFFLCIIIGLIVKKYINLSTKKTILVSLIIILFLGIVWVTNTYVYPSTDSGYILYGADAFHQKDFNWLKTGHYFDKYPFQLGFLFYL